MKMGEHGWPTCAVCNKPVDELTEMFDQTRGAAGIIVFIAKCHGQEERIEVTPLFLDAYEHSFSLNGVAFSQHLPLLRDG